jgi:hypothetical protein
LEIFCPQTHSKMAWIAREFHRVCQRCAGDRKFNINFVVADVYTFLPANMENSTQPRVFRIVASLVGLQLVTSLVAVAKSLGQSRETAQRQLNAEKKKRKEGPRIESLNKSLSEKHEKITMVEEMMRKMFTGLFMHRYRDVDPEIRQACISAMGSWIVSYPSLFLQDLYLKYIGWTLNDKVFLATISPGRL